MQTVDLPGVRIMVRTEGDQSAPPVLLLHGLGRDGSDLSPVGSALAGDHWVISPDQRGHGASGRADEYGFEWMRDDAVRLLDALGIERADLVGHSMGANVAWLVAAHYPTAYAGWSRSMRSRLAAGEHSSHHRSRTQMRIFRSTGRSTRLCCGSSPSPSRTGGLAFAR